METTATRMVRGQDPIRRRLRRKVLLPMTKNGFAHEIPDSPHAGAPSNLAQKVLCTCCRHYSGAASGRITSLISSRRSSLPRKGCRVGLRIVLFEACSASACTLALPPIRDTLIEGFSHFIALHDYSDCFRLERLPGGACTHWKAPPCHGAHPYETFGVEPPLWPAIRSDVATSECASAKDTILQLCARAGVPGVRLHHA